MLKILPCFYRFNNLRSSRKKVKHQQQQQQRVTFYSFVCLWGVSVYRDLFIYLTLAISFIRHYLYFLCDPVRSWAFLCITRNWLCIQICLYQKLFVNPVISFAFARFVYIVHSQYDILKATRMPYYFYCKSMNQHLNAILFIILSILFGIWMQFFIGNLLNFLLRNRRIHCGWYSPTSTPAFQHRMSIPFYISSDFLQNFVHIYHWLPFLMYCSYLDIAVLFQQYLTARKNYFLG